MILIHIFPHLLGYTSMSSRIDKMHNVQFLYPRQIKSLFILILFSCPDSLCVLNGNFLFLQEPCQISLNFPQVLIFEI